MVGFVVAVALVSFLHSLTKLGQVKFIFSGNVSLDFASKAAVLLVNK